MVLIYTQKNCRVPILLLIFNFDMRYIYLKLKIKLWKEKKVRHRRPLGTRAVPKRKSIFGSFFLSFNSIYVFDVFALRQLGTCGLIDFGF